MPHQGRIYAMARDETEQKHAEDGLREAQQELERVSRQTTLGARTASIAHEINQPLSAIVAHGNAGLRWQARKYPNLDEAQKALSSRSSMTAASRKGSSRASGGCFARIVTQSPSSASTI